MKTTGLLLTTCLVALLFACSNNQKENNNLSKSINADSEEKGFISSSAAVENGKDTTHKFIRTADLQFKVKNVIHATYAIENITSRFDGFVTYTKLNSNIDHKTTIAVSADSSLETTYYTVVNDIVLRVPNTELDTTLKSIALLIDFLDHRIIKADDIASQLLSNKLKQDRVAKNEQRLVNAIDSQGRKLKETTHVEELLMEKQEQSDHAKISNLSLQDQVNFSTVTISIYQRQELKRELIQNDKNIDSYKPNLASRITEAFKTGWLVLEEIIIFMAQLWWLIVFAVPAYLLYKKGNKKN